MKTVLKGKEWTEYLLAHNFKEIARSINGQAQLYSGVTWKYHAIYKIGDYYFTFAYTRGYKNISSLKKQLL